MFMFGMTGYMSVTCQSEKYDLVSAKLTSFAGVEWVLLLRESCYLAN